MFISELFDRLPTLINKTADVDGIQVSINTNEKNASAYASSGGRRLGYAEFDRDGNTLVPYDLAVDDKYRGQGIAAVIYDYVKSLGFTIQASAEQTDAGKYFWSKNRGNKRIWEARMPAEVEDFLYDLTPGDAGVDEVGPYRIHYEGFTDDCQSAGDYCENPEAVYQQVFADHIAREGGRKPIDQNFTGDEDYPILYSVFKIPTQKSVNEITSVPSVAKSKRQHLDVMPNDGRPIPKGDEQHHLGEFISKMPGGYELWGWDSRWDRTYFVFDPETRISQLATTGKQYPENPDSFVVLGLYSGPKNQVRGADLYAFLIRHLGLTLVSDNKQSEGGYRVWQELERRYGKTINVHGFDTRTDKGINVTTQDEPDTHVARADVKRAGPQGKKELATISRDLRFVASAK